MKVLGLDFDGVISNNLWDSLLTGYNVYRKFNPGTKIFGGVELTYENFNKIRLMNNDIFYQFRFLRSFAGAGMSQVLIFYVIDRKEEIKSQLEYDIFVSGFAESILKTFQDEFYVERNRLKSLDLQSWLKMSPPFAEILPQVEKLLENHNVFIVTSKDKDSVIMLCEQYGIKIDEKKIIGKDMGLNKAEKLDALAKQLNVEKQEIGLVDDLFKHLLEVQEAGFKPFFATWGYTTKELTESAASMGITLLTKDNFYDVINAELTK